MVAITIEPPISQTGPPAAAWLGDTLAANASIAAYVRAGERMLSLMDATCKACAVLFVVVALAWILGVLPGAVRLF
jgi:hypothetical protein